MSDKITGTPAPTTPKAPSSSTPPAGYSSGGNLVAGVGSGGWNQPLTGGWTKGGTSPKK
jgi:hypothetical protein